MTVVVQGRSSLAKLLRLLADQIEDGSLIHPISVSPAPHLGPYCVRVGGVDYDLAVGLPGVIPDAGELPQEEDTSPGKLKPPP